MPSLQLTYDATPIRVPTTTTLASDFKAAIAALITGFTNWRVVYNPGGAQPVILAPPLGTPLEKMRVVIAGSTATAPNAAQVFSPHTAVSGDAIYVGVGFAVNATDTAPDNAWDSASAQYTTRWTKYVRGPSSGVWEIVSVTTSDDTVSIIIGRPTDDTVRHFRAGAIGIAPTVETGDSGTTRRLIGVMTSGSDAIPSNWYETVSTTTSWWMNFMNADSPGASQPLAIIFHPATPTVAVRVARNFGYVFCEPEGSGTDPFSSTNPNRAFRTPTVSPNVVYMPDVFPMNIRDSADVSWRVGYWRQFAFYGKALAGEVIRDYDQNVVGYTISGSRVSIQGAMIETNNVLLPGIEDAVE